MAVNLLIKQVIGETFLVTPEGEYKDIKIGSKINSQDVISVPFGKNAWLVSQQGEQVDMLDYTLLVGPSHVNTLKLPNHLINALSQFVSLNPHDSPLNKSSVKEAEDIELKIINAFMRLGLTAEQSKTLVEKRYKPFMHGKKSDELVSITPIPIIKNISDYHGRIVATIKKHEPENRHYKISIMNEPYGDFFTLKGNMVLLTDAGAEAVTSQPDLLNNLTVKTNIALTDLNFDIVTKIPFIENQHSAKSVKHDHVSVKNDQTSPQSAPNTRETITKENKNTINNQQDNGFQSEQNATVNDETISASPNLKVEWEQRHAESEGLFSLSGVLPSNLTTDKQFPFSMLTARGEFNLHLDGRWSYFCDDPTGSVSRLPDTQTMQEIICFPLNEKMIQLVIDITKHKGLPKITQVDLQHLPDNAPVYSVQGNTALVHDKDEQGEEIKTYTGRFGQLTVSDSGHWHYQTEQAQAETIETLQEGEMLNEVFSLRNDDHEPLKLLIMLRRLNRITLIPSLISSVNEIYTLGKMKNAFEKMNTLFPQRFDGFWGKLSISIHGQWLYSVNKEKITSAMISDGEIGETFIINTGKEEEVINFKLQKMDDVVAFTQIDMSEFEPQNNCLRCHGSVNFYSPTLKPFEFEDSEYKGKQGYLSLLSNGKWQYQTLPSEFKTLELLDVGELITDVICIEQNSTYSMFLDINILGTHDRPVIASQLVVDVIESKYDVTISTSGRIAQQQDNENTAIVFKEQEKEGIFGFLSINNNEWHYTLNNAARERFEMGEIYTDTFLINSQENNQYSLVISITGGQEKPVLFGNITGELNSLKINSIHGKMDIFNQFDAENIEYDDALLEGKFGTLEIQNGEWRYTLSAYLLSYLPDGEMRYDPFTVNQANNINQHIFITITGTDEEPILHAQTSSTSLDHASFPTLSGELTFNNDKNYIVKNKKFAGSYGSLVILDNHWTYSLDPEVPEYIQLAETLTDLITIPLMDEAPVDVEIEINHNINGINLRCLPSPSLVEQPDTLLISGDLVVTPQQKDEQSAALLDTKISANYGVFSISEQHWTYQLDPELVSILSNGMTVSDLITLNDDQGGKHQLTIKAESIHDSTKLSLTPCPSLQSVFNPVSKSLNKVVEKPSEKDIILPRPINGQSNAKNQESSKNANFDLSTIVVEKFHYPSVSGGIHLHSDDPKKHATMEYTVLEGKYGSLSLLNAHWIYTFSPDKVLPYCAETREFFVIIDSIGSQHEIIITIESGMKKPMITDVIIGKSSEALQSNIQTHDQGSV